MSSLVFLFVIHTMWQGCKDIYDMLYCFHKDKGIEIIFIIHLVDGISAFFISFRNVMICSSNHC